LLISTSHRPYLVGDLLISTSHRPYLAAALLNSTIADEMPSTDDPINTWMRRSCYCEQGESKDFAQHQFLCALLPTRESTSTKIFLELIEAWSAPRCCMGAGVYAQMGRTIQKEIPRTLGT